MSDLVGCWVLDADGGHVGKVKDVQLVQDGPYVEGFGHQLRVDGILTGRGAVAVRLGFGRADVTGPWPLTTIFRRLERRARYFDWTDVASWDEGTIRLRAGARSETVA